MTIFILFALMLLYFLPAICAIAAPRKRNWGGILILDLFLGWTIIGWVGALIWAACPD